MNPEDVTWPADSAPGLTLGQKVLVGILVGALVGAVSAYAGHHVPRLVARTGEKTLTRRPRAS